MIRGQSDTTRRLQEWAEANGWSVHQTRGDHLAFTHPRIPSRKVFASLTPSCPKGWMISRARMHRLMAEHGLSEQGGSHAR